MNFSTADGTFPSNREKEKSAFLCAVFPILPGKLQAEIRRIALAHGGAFRIPEELLLRRNTPVSMKIAGKRLLLSYRPTGEDVKRVLLLACRGSLYAFRDCLSAGYLPLAGGVRIGVAGCARTDGGSIVGVGDAESLLFRMPSVSSEVGDGLYAAFCENKGGGMLIFSPPGGGKTSALRAVAKRIGQAGVRLIIADDRGEFPEALFPESSISILRGYPKGEAVRIAVRTLSPEVILIDEIGSVQEAESLRLATGAGIPLLASAHAGSIEELCRRELLRPLLQCGAFSLFAELIRAGNTRRVHFYPSDDSLFAEKGEKNHCLC